MGYGDFQVAGLATPTAPRRATLRGPRWSYRRGASHRLHFGPSKRGKPGDHMSRRLRYGPRFHGQTVAEVAHGWVALPDSEARAWRYLRRKCAAQTPAERQANGVKGALAGQLATDTGRADRGLRRFSWEDDE